MVDHDGVDDIRTGNSQDLVSVPRQEVVGRVLERPRYHRRTVLGDGCEGDTAVIG